MKTYEEALIALDDALGHAYDSTIARRRWDKSEETAKLENHAFDKVMDEMAYFVAYLYGKTVEQVIDDFNDLDGMDFRL